LVTEADLIESASTLEISDQRVEKWSDAWRRQQLARAFDMHGNFDGWRDLAQAFQREGSYDLAIKVWEKALERNPLNSMHFENEIVRAYDAKAVHEDPVEVYEKALEDHPTIDALCHRLGDSLIAKQDYTRMIRVFEHWHQVRPDESKFSLSLAQAYSATENLDKAISVLIKAVEDHPGESALYRQLGQCYVGKAEFHRAIGVLKAGCLNSRNKSDIALTRDLAKLYEKVGEIQTAIQMLELNFRSHPTDPDLFDDLCALGNYKGALSILQATLDSNLRSANIPPIIRAYKLKQDYLGGIKFLSRYLDSGPLVLSRLSDTTFPRVLRETISDLLKVHGDQKGWLHFCESVAREHQNERWAWNLFAKACEANGDLAKAERIESALRNPNFLYQK